MMRTIALQIGFALLGLFYCCPTGAQIVLTTNDFPSQVGEYFRGYLFNGGTTSSISVGGLPGATNGPQVWDLSWAQESFETIQRTDIVGPNDAGDASSFPNATYAERDTNETDSGESWNYYSLTNTGRLFYGIDDPVDEPVTPLAIFNSPTMDFPCPLQFGQGWSRTVSWTQVVSEFEILATDFSSQAVVDAYGTVILPIIGQVPTLRVDEVDTYTYTYNGSPYQTATYRNYYWLVRGIGIAAEVCSQPQMATPPQVSIPPTDFTSASITLRVFEASDPKDALSPVSGLTFGLAKGVATLNWNAVTNAGTSYRVESTANLASPAWQLFSLPSTNSCTNSIAPLGTQEYFRVFSKP